MISKKGDDARKILMGLIKAFNGSSATSNLYGTVQVHRKELILSEPTKKRRAGELKRIRRIRHGYWLAHDGTKCDGWRKSTVLLLDEANTKDVPFDRYWSIVKTSHRLGAIVVGKSFVVSTVNAKRMVELSSKKYSDSDVLNRNLNDQTGVDCIVYLFLLSMD
jgi:hypothetical protein